MFGSETIPLPVKAKEMIFENTYLVQEQGGMQVASLLDSFANNCDNLNSNCSQ